MTRAAPPPVQARRFLHCCYCCDDPGTVAGRFETALGLETRMRSAGARVDGSQLGFSGLVETDTHFLYDRRGPRVSPAIEVQGWVDPPPTGEPYPTASNVGFQAIGIGAPTIDTVVQSLVGSTSTVVGRTSDRSEVLPSGSVIVRDPTGLTIDVLDRSDDDATQLVHIRATCSDLARSLAWYRALGFDVVNEEQNVQIDAAPFGLPADARASFARLSLPDEPFALVLVEWHEPPSHGLAYHCGNHRGLFRVAVAVDDTRAAFARLTEAGWSLSSGPEQIELAGTPVPDMWIGFLTDPDGLTIELVERPRSAFR